MASLAHADAGGSREPLIAPNIDACHGVLDDNDRNDMRQVIKEHDEAFEQRNGAAPGSRFLESVKQPAFAPRVKPSPSAGAKRRPAM